MRLNPKEQEKLMLHMAGNLAKERKERGLKLNYVEALAYISSELLELARDGKTVVELMQLGTKILTKDQVHAKFSKQCVRLRFQICVHADTDVCGISSHTINPFLLAIIVYDICTKKTILCTNI